MGVKLPAAAVGPARRMLVVLLPDTLQLYALPAGLKAHSAEDALARLRRLHPHQLTEEGHGRLELRFLGALGRLLRAPLVLGLMRGHHAADPSELGGGGVTAQEGSANPRTARGPALLIGTTHSGGTTQAARAVLCAFHLRLGTQCTPGATAACLLSTARCTPVAAL